MNRNLMLAGLFLLCSVMNMVNVITTSNGFSFALGLAWLIGSIVMFMRYRKEKKDNEQEAAE